MQVARLDHLHQAGTRLGDHPHIAGKTVEQGSELGALQRAGGSQHPDNSTASGGGLTALVNVVRALFAIGNMPAVGDIQQRFVGQQGLYFIEHRQAANTGVEHPDRCLTHGGCHKLRTAGRA